MNQKMHGIDGTISKFIKEKLTYFLVEQNVTEGSHIY